LSATFLMVLFTMSHALSAHLVVSVVEEMLEGLQTFSGCFFHTLAVCFFDCVVFEFVRAVRCAWCLGHLYVLLVRLVCG